MILFLCMRENLTKWSPNLLERSEQAIKRYKNLDDDPRGVWSSSDLTARNYYSQGTYEVTSPDGKKFRPSVGNYFRVSPDKFDDLDKDGRIWWGPNGASMPRLKRYLSEVKKGVVPQTFVAPFRCGTYARRQERTGLSIRLQEIRRCVQYSQTNKSD